MFCIPTEEMTISTHAPRTGSDVSYSAHSFAISTFQPTLPARGATAIGKDKYNQQQDFNPRSPHGERRQGQHDADCQPRISTHAPRTGSDGTDSVCV